MSPLRTDLTAEEKAKRAEKAGVELYTELPPEPELDYEIKRRLPELAQDLPAKIIATGTLDEATKLALTLSGSDRGSMNTWHAVLPEGVVVESASVSSKLRLEQSQGLFVEPVPPLEDPLARETTEARRERLEREKREAEARSETPAARQEREARERAKGREPIP